MLVIANLPVVGSLATGQESVEVLVQRGNESRPSPQQAVQRKRRPTVSGTRWRTGRGPIHEIDVDITPGPGPVPASVEIDDPAGHLPDRPSAHRNSNSPIRFSWKTSGLYHYPLYFEDETLERQGRSRPLAAVHSGIHFFANLAVLPLHLAHPTLATGPSNCPKLHGPSRQR
ncbi:MAG: hypothetical protein CMJ70_18535 [Planctomycetaceae bacterium]|nr:hypothetical protein [Planctomycetaceae bacterium]HAA71386.1 hypothetical protein [Planctomycetaceae bacterium]